LSPRKHIHCKSECDVNASGSSLIAVVPSDHCIKPHLYASFAENIEELFWLSATSEKLG